LEEVEIVRPGYAVEYDFVDPTELKPSLETKKYKGYSMPDRSMAHRAMKKRQPGVDGRINAVLQIRGEEPLVLKRSEAYIGVLIDDLVTKGTTEPTGCSLPARNTGFI